MKELDNVYTINTTQIHTNKYIEHDLSKPKTTSMREKAVNNYANAQTESVCDRVLT